MGGYLKDSLKITSLFFQSFSFTLKTFNFKSVLIELIRNKY